MSRDEIRGEVARMPLDPDVTVAPRPYPHPWTLVRRDLDLLPVIAVGGALGSLARWGLSRALPHASADFAWATLLTNLSGAFVLGLLMAYVLDVGSSRRYVRPFLGVGVLGGYTTFSTWMLDTRGVLAAGRVGVAAAYLVATLLGGVVAAGAGLAVGRWAIDVRRPAEAEAAE